MDPVNLYCFGVTEKRFAYFIGAPRRGAIRNPRRWRRSSLFALWSLRANIHQ